MASLLSILYPLGFIVSLSGLIGWFYNQGSGKSGRTMSKLFLGGFIIYLLSLAFSEGELSQKMWVLGRDFIVLALISQFFSFFKRYKMVFFVMLAFLYGIFFMKYGKVMQQSFPANLSTPKSGSIQLDQDAELLADLSLNFDQNVLNDIVEKYDLQISQAFSPADPSITELDDYITINIPDHQLKNGNQIQNELREQGIIDYVEINELIQLDDPATSTAPQRGNIKYGVDDPELNKLWGFEAMKMDKYYQFLKNNAIKPQKKAAIFILDTGVDAKHEDLKAHYKSVKKAYDKDVAAHGTHCAGIAAAVSNNGKGIASYSFDIPLITVTSIKVLTDFGSGTQKGILRGIIEAADNGADVISMSLGGRASRNKTKAYKDAVKYANDKGAIVIVAAGNSNMNAKDYAPANTPGVITVSAIDTVINRASFSNTVNDLDMGIAAPGVQIYSTIPNSKYAAFNGTSMATPYVAGLVGVMKSFKPDLDTQTAYDILNNTGVETGQVEETGKLIQPEDALKALLTIY